jgi:hypothetical protein
MKKIGRHFIKFEMKRTNGDPEKAVLPTIVFINPKHPEFIESNYCINYGFTIILCWWDYGILFGFYKTKKKIVKISGIKCNVSQN